MRRLMHPQHGWHVVSAGDDVDLMKRNGWVDDDGKALAEKLARLGLAPTESGFKEGHDHIALVKAAVMKTFPDLKQRRKRA